MAFQMQDVLLEPYGGEVLGPVGFGHHALDRDLGGRRARRVCIGGASG